MLPGRLTERTRWVEWALLLMLVPLIVMLLLAAPGSPSPAAPEFASGPAVAAVPSGEARYMPLTAQRTLTYRTLAGDQFTLTFGTPMAVTWFDDTLRRVVPVRDSRCGCQVLLQDFEGGAVRAVGTISGDRMQMWGEPLTVFPGVSAGVPDPIRTPAGSFPDAVRVDSDGGSAWFAPGVGLVQVNEYRLVIPRPAI